MSLSQEHLAEIITSILLALMSTIQQQSYQQQLHQQQLHQQQSHQQQPHQQPHQQQLYQEMTATRLINTNVSIKAIFIFLEYY
jgi:hypothetical protein